MIHMTAPWFRPFRRQINHDNSFDSICNACCRTIARCQLYSDLEQIEEDHVCDGSDLRRVCAAGFALRGLPAAHGEEAVQELSA
jgi:hypothetical protein